VPIPEGRNVTQKDAEKKIKYKSLCTKIQWMWNMKCFIIQELIGTRGIVTQNFRPLVPKFAGSNPAEAVGFFRAKKSSARLPSEGKQNRGSHVVDLRHVKDP
jgi:hypothetical protein